MNGSRIKSGMGILFFVIAFFIAPKIASAATLYLNPSSGSHGVGSTFIVTIQTNTQGVAVNTAEARISYSTNTLEIVSVRQGSNFYLASPGSPQRGSGTIYFGGGLPNPGYTGPNGSLGIITFRAIAEGTATVSVDSGQVLLNDGLGTNALTSSSGARFTIGPPPVGGVIVTSTTHPQSDSWYSKKTVDFSWNRPNNAYGFSFDFNQIPDTVPDQILDTTITTTKSYSDLTDGVWYFHIRARPQSPTSSFGLTTHFKIQIDTVAPAAFNISVAESTLTFEATDELSGVDHYEVSADGKKVEGDKSPVTVFGLKDGTHQIVVSAIDKAGNRKDSTTTMEVHGVTIGFFERSLQIPVYLILLLNILILILIAIVLWLLLRKKHSRSASNEISKLQAEIDELKREYAEEANLKKKIRKTKKDIESKLTKIRK